MKYLFKLLLIVFLVNSFTIFGQTNDICQMPASDSWTRDYSGACQPDDLGDWITYSDLDTYIPYLNSNYPLQNAPITTIQVNIHIFQKDDGTGNFTNSSTDLARLKGFITNVNSFYSNYSPSDPLSWITELPNNDSRIRFSLGDVGNERIYFYQDDQEWASTSTGTNYLNTNHPERLEQLNIYIRGNPNNYTHAYANYPSWTNLDANSYTVMFYRGPDNDWARAGTLAHELGHNLHLLHTYYGGNASAICDQSNDEYLTDIFLVNPPAGSNCPHICDWAANASTINGDKITNNLMGGNKSAAYISPKQAGQMHRSLALSSVRRYVTCEKSPIPLEISSDEEWDFNIKMYRDIIVKTGARLTLSCHLVMHKDANIFVEIGGELFVDDGTVTSFKGETWQGIIVEGQANLNQNQSNQGAVRISNGAIIENAIYGVQLFVRQSNGEPNPTTGGGIIVADGATFKNNKVAIAAGYYNYSNSSGVLNCDFIIDAEYYTKSQTRPIFASLHNINLFSFGHNHFKYDVASTLAPTLITPIGIKSYNSKVAANRNTFENLQYGVHATELNYSRTSDISNNTFTKNLTGIYMSGANSPQITFNSFEVMAYHSSLPFSQNFTGVYLDGTYGHSVEENSFVADVTSFFNAGESKIGLLINNGGTQSVEVYKNTFDYFSYAILAQNDNRSSNGLAGLCFKCNDFNNNKSDISVTYNGSESPKTGVAINQGSPGPMPSDPAGNLFSSISSGVSWHFRNIDGIDKHISYFHHNLINSSRLAPYATKSNNVQNIQNIFAPYVNACLTNYTGGGIGIAKSEAKSRLDDAKENELIATSSLESLTDNGDTPALQADIATAAPNEAMEMRSELLNVAPYTSEEVLVEATQKEDVLNNALIRDVLVANPQAAKSQEVMTAIEDRATTMPQYMKDQINEGLTTVSAKEELEATAFYNRTSYTNALSDMVFLLLSDTIGNPMDSVILLLEQSHYLYAKYQLADIYLNQLNASALNLVFENISNDFNLKNEFLIEYEQLQEYYEFMLAVNNEDRTIFELTATEKASLLSYYENSNNLAAINARNILNEIGEIEYTEPYVFPEEEMKSSYVTITDPKSSSNATSNNEMQVYPNPAKDYLICEYDMAKVFTSCSLSIIKSGSGKSLYTQVLKHQQDAITIDLKGFTTGQYILVLTTDGQVSHQTKFNIVK